MPDVATEVLLAGCDAIEVAVLAGFHRPTSYEVDEELNEMFRRLEVQRPTEREAAKTVADDVAGRIVGGSIRPRDGARALAELYDNCDRDLDVQLHPFFTLWLSWLDYEAERPRIEEEIVREATALVDAGGLRID